MGGKKAIFNWSGGKDSSLALYHILKGKEYDISCLLTTINEEQQRISMHGVRNELLEQQANSIGLPLFKVMMDATASMESYNRLMQQATTQLVDEGNEYSIFGDIFLEDLKQYREQQLALVGLKAVFPLWQRPTAELLNEFIDLGFKAVLVCVNEKHLGSEFAGRLIDKYFVKDLPKGVDPCGENGEYHSFVFDGPIFSQPIKYELGELVYKKFKADEGANFDTGFFYRDIVPALAVATG